MANFITDEVKQEIIGMLTEHLDDEQEGIDDLFGDQEENSNRKVTMTFRVNMAAKSDTQIEIKVHSDYVLEPSIPAKHKKSKLVRVIDTAQQTLPMDEVPNQEKVVDIRE